MAKQEKKLSYTMIILVGLVAVFAIILLVFSGKNTGQASIQKNNQYTQSAQNFDRSSLQSIRTEAIQSTPRPPSDENCNEVRDEMYAWCTEFEGTRGLQATLGCCAELSSGSDPWQACDASSSNCDSCGGKFWRASGGGDGLCLP